MSERVPSEAEQLAQVLDDWVPARAHAVTIVAERSDAADVARAAADVLARRASVSVVSHWADAAKSDVVVLYREKEHDAWAAQLVELGKLAALALIVVVRNPRGLLDRVAGDAPPPMCHTKAIAPVLWQIGRVREHLFLDAGSLAMVEQMAPKLRPRLARLHAFLVDTTPRTPQARRKLHTV